MPFDLKPYPQYKKSELPWLNIIPNHWDLVRNKVLFDTRKEIVGEKSSDFILLSLTLNGIIKRDMINPKGKFPAEFNTYQIVRKNDFVFCLFDVDETPRTIGISPFNGMITGAYTVFKPKTPNTQFLYYYYLHLDNTKALKPIYTGLRKVIPEDRFLRTKTPFPPVEEQKQIAGYLNWKTTQIAKFIKAKKRLIELLKEQKQVIINDAVTGKIDVRTGKPYPKYKDSVVEWLGEIPEHWEGRKLKTFCSLISKGTTPSTEGKGFVDYGIRFIKAENISNGRLNQCPEFFIDSETDNLLKRSKLKENDILIVIAGATIGKVAIMSKDFLPANTNQAVCFLRLFQPFHLKYIYYTLQSKYLKSIINLFSVQSAQPNLAMGVLKNFVLPIPNNDEIIDIVSFIERNEILIGNAILKIQSEITILQEYRTRLIADSVTGKIDIRETSVPDITIESVLEEIDDIVEIEEDIDGVSVDIDL